MQVDAAARFLERIVFAIDPDHNWL